MAHDSASTPHRRPRVLAGNASHHKAGSHILEGGGENGYAYPAVPGSSIPPFGPLLVNKAPIGRQIGIAASLATKKVRPASEASKTSAWAIVAVTWDSGISLPSAAHCRACAS